MKTNRPYPNYRVQIYPRPPIDYRKDFSRVREELYPIAAELTALVDPMISWFFFEPYLEFTWLSLSDDAMERVSSYLKGKDLRFTQMYPDDGMFCAWYHRNQDECFFETQSYSNSAHLASTFYNSKEGIQKGKGLENQYARHCHVLANQLGFNYKDEARILSKRAVLAWLFWVNQKRAVKIYNFLFPKGKY